MAVAFLSAQRSKDPNSQVLSTLGLQATKSNNQGEVTHIHTIGLFRLRPCFSNKWGQSVCCHHSAGILGDVLTAGFGKMTLEIFQHRAVAGHA